MTWQTCINESVCQRCYCELDNGSACKCPCHTLV